MERNGIWIRNYWDAPVYRTFPLQRALELFKEGKNVLVHPCLWDDPFENFFLKNGAIDEHGNLVPLDDIHKDWYGQCWTLEGESDALWRIYSPEKGGVRLSTTIRRLFQSFYNSSDELAPNKYFIGKVRYYTLEELNKYIDETTFSDIGGGAWPYECAPTLLMKREAFSHEKEIRLLFFDFYHDTGKNCLSTFHLDANSVFDEVVLDPRLKKPIETDAIEARLKDAGCTLRISRSDLYDSPSRPIRLTN